MAAGHSPLEQFEIHRLVPLEVGGVDISFTNSALFMVAALAIGSAYLMLGMRRRAVVPGRLQSLAELTYEFVGGLIRVELLLGYVHVRMTRRRVRRQFRVFFLRAFVLGRHAVVLIMNGL